MVTVVVARQVSALQAESRGLFHGLSEALKGGFTSIEMEGDYLTAINVLKGCRTCLWEVKTTISDILVSTVLLTSPPSPTFAGRATGWQTALPISV